MKIIITYFLNIRIISILILLSFFATNVALAGSKKLVPKNYKKKVNLLISGNKRAYYIIPSTNYSVITVKESGWLKIITRAKIKKGKKDNINYTISYKIDGERIKTIKFVNVVKSNSAEYSKDKGGFPGAARNIIIELEKGEHLIEVKNLNPDVEIVARYLFTQNKPNKTKWITINPIAALEPVDLITREKITHYYRFSETKPLIIEIIGPTKLKVLTRFENNYKMKGKINYRLKVTNEERELNTFILSSYRSEVTTYVNNSELLPGRAIEIYIKVPEGKHQYKIIPLDKDKGTILGRIFFPKKDAKNKVS